MREVKIAEDILDNIREIQDEYGSSLNNIHIRIGEFNEPDYVTSWLRKLSVNEFESTEFIIERVPIRLSCNCGFTGGVESISHYHGVDPVLSLYCPECGDKDFSLDSGFEKEIVDFELRIDSNE